MHLYLQNAEQIRKVRNSLLMIIIFREEELYFVLLDIMRSPEMIKQITGSSQKKKID
jgi:hypothetical protein